MAAASEEEEGKSNKNWLTGKYDMKLLNAMSDVDDQFKERLVAFYGVEDEDDLKEVNEAAYDFETFTKLVEPKLEEAQMRTELEALIKEETGKDGTSRAEHINWVVAEIKKAVGA